jgi:hypothetical protein
MLTLFAPTLLDYVDDLITAATGAGDTLGEVGFGIIPIVIYIGIIAAAGWTHVATYRRVTRGSRKGSKSPSRIAYV